MNERKSEKNKHEAMPRQLNEVKKLKVLFTPPDFSDYAPPNGFIPMERGAHALMYYALLARKQYEELIVDPIFLEGSEDLVPNFVQLFKSIAMAYGTTPERMVRFWSNVDMQFTMMKLPKLPEGDRYRFNTIAHVITETKQ